MEDDKRASRVFDLWANYSDVTKNSPKKAICYTL